jgi:hypothetical protein
LRNFSLSPADRKKDFAVLCAIEVKSEAGRLSPEQKELGRDIILNGGIYVVARSIDDVQHAGL